MLYVYAITDCPSRPRGTGLRRTRPRTVGEEVPFAVVSDHDPRFESREEDLWAHEQVVEDLMKTGSVLPLRFGTRVPDEATLRSVLQERRDEFDLALKRVRGAVELGVRAQIRALPARLPNAATRPTDAGATGAGTEYMLGRLERERQIADVIARVHEPLAALARRSARRPAGAGAGAFKAAYLVDSDRIELFRRRVDELSQEVEGATLVCTGPWPPYSFTSPDGRTSAHV